jgi:hypothetical protein
MAATAKHAAKMRFLIGESPLLLWEGGPSILTRESWLFMVFDQAKLAPDVLDPTLSHWVRMPENVF